MRPYVPIGDGKDGVKTLIQKVCLCIVHMLFG
jgi:hypothetical protein